MLSIQELLLVLLPLTSIGSVSAQANPPRSYTASAGFPNNIFSSYYIVPDQKQQPQPKIYDEAINFTYPLDLTNPKTIPNTNNDPIYFANPVSTTSSASDLISQGKADVTTILATSLSDCDKCLKSLPVIQYVSQRLPQNFTDVFQTFCTSKKIKQQDLCVLAYRNKVSRGIWSQIFAFSDMTGLDGQYACNQLGYCPMPFTLRSSTSAFFGAKPKNPTVPKPSGNRVKVLHLSDLHLDPRYAVGAEAKCNTGLCCRPSSSGGSSTIAEPAPLYGSYKCDTPYYLMTSALESIAPLTGTSRNSSSSDDHFAWTIFTGDVVSHGGQSQSSRDYVTYSEWATYHMMLSYLPSGPVFAALGNHDSSPEAIDVPYSLPGNLGQQQSWNYDHVASLWQHNGWMTEADANQARTHYAGYSVHHPRYPKLRIISINTDFWYWSNIYNVINSTNPDNSGQLKFLASELTSAEAAGERVWIIGHVPSGFGAGSAFPNPSDLFYQIVDRFSPHVIAAIFFGHTHQDHLMIYYANNATTRNAQTAQTVGWIGPSLTTYSNLNVGYRMYEVDTGDFSIYEAYTYYGDASTFGQIDPSVSGPTFQFEYSTRDAYPIGWPANAPLNATYWHRVTEAMGNNRTMMIQFARYQTKLSPYSSDCSSDACANGRLCAIRSASSALARQCKDNTDSTDPDLAPNDSMDPDPSYVNSNPSASQSSGSPANKIASQVSGESTPTKTSGAELSRVPLLRLVFSLILIALAFFS